MNQLHMSTVSSPIGTLRVVCNSTHIIRLLFEQDKPEQLSTWLKRYAGGADIGSGNELSELCCKELIEYFEGRRKEFSLPRLYFGTAFQKKIWNTLDTLPFRALVSYSQLGTMASVKGARAIGSAVGDNPIPIICPCHRVLRSDGSLGGYSGGLEKKIKLLSVEGHQLTDRNKVN